MILNEIIDKIKNYISNRPNPTKTVADPSVITVKNAQGDADTTANVLIQNQIDYVPKVSVIIPVFNAEDYLVECLDSVTGQTLKEIEIICINDGSADGSLAILKKYASQDSRITVINQNNSGAGIARNCGIGVAVGEFIAFMDPDDFYPSEHTLEHLYNKAKEHRVDICGGTMNRLKDGKTVVAEEYLFRKYGLIEYLDYQFDYGYTRFIYKRQLLQDNDVLFPDYLRQQDPVFFVHAMIVAGRFYAINEPTYIYRVAHTQKQIEWTRRKCIDVAKSLRDLLVLSDKAGLSRLHKNMSDRVIQPYFVNVFKNLVDENGVPDENLVNLLASLNYEKIYSENPSFALSYFYKTVPALCKISVIIPVYNVEKYLAQCLDSVINQTYKNIEIICVNDGSTDGSLKILEQYAAKDKRIKIISQKNAGLNGARNTGLRNATGTYITFIDSDDWMDLDWVEKAHDAAVANNADLVKSGYLHHWEDRSEPDGINKKIDARASQGQYLGINENNIVAWATLYAKSFIDKNDLYFDPYIRKHEDILYTLKATFLANKIVPLTGTYINYRRTSSILSLFNKSEYDLLPIINSKAIPMLNSFDCNKSDYIAAVKRLWWRTQDAYDKRDQAPGVTDDELQNYLDKNYAIFRETRWPYEVFDEQSINKIGITRKSKNALLIELNDCHGECLPGYCKYLLDLGYNVDVLVNKVLEKEAPMRVLDGQSCVKTQYMSDKEIIDFVHSRAADDYDVCLFNSHILYIYGGFESALKYIDIASIKPRVIFVEHRLENLPELTRKANVLLLKKFYNYRNTFEVNPHYFGEHGQHNKGHIVNFVVAGNIQKARKNYDLLINAVTELINKNITNFKITVIGRGNLGDLPENIKRFFDIKGRVSYPDLYRYVSDADFLLPLLDPDFKEHDRYLKDGTSGSFQLIYGLNIPCLIAHKFAKCHHFSSDNAICYDKNSQLVAAMTKCIDMSTDDYLKIKENLQKTADEIYKTSLHNLECAINTPHNDSTVLRWLLLPYYLIANMWMKKKLLDSGFYGQKVDALPNINADAFISLGDACSPAYWLTHQGLRQYALPFDWMMHYDLDLVLDTLLHSKANWFTDFTEEPTQNPDERCVKDNTSQMISLHHFPKEHTVKDYLPVFNSIFRRRKERFCKILSGYKNICFVMTRTILVAEIVQFMQKLCQMYPTSNFWVINVRQDDTSTDILKHQVNEKCCIYDVHFNDINEDGDQKKAWIGNTKFWEKLVSKLHLNTNVAEINDDNSMLSYAEELTANINLLQKQQNATSQQFNADIIKTKEQIVNLATETQNQMSQLSQKLDALNGQTTSHLNVIDSRFSESRLQLDTLAQQFAAAIHNCDMNVNDLAVKFAQNISAVSNGLTGVIDTKYNELISKMRDTTEANAMIIGKAYNEMSDRLDKNIASVDQKVKNFADSIIHVIDENVAETNKKYADMIGGLDAQFAAIDVKIKDLHDTVVRIIGENAIVTNKKRADMIDNFDAQFASIGLKMKDLSDNIVQIIDVNATETNKKYADMIGGLDTQFASIGLKMKDLSDNIVQIIDVNATVTNKKRADMIDKFDAQFASIDVKTKDLFNNIVQLMDENVAVADKKYVGVSVKLDNAVAVLDNMAKDISNKMVKLANTDINLISMKHKELTDRLNKNSVLLGNVAKDLSNKLVKIANTHSAKHKELSDRLNKNATVLDAKIKDVSDKVMRSADEHSVALDKKYQDLAGKLKETAGVLDTMSKTLSDKIIQTADANSVALDEKYADLSNQLNTNFVSVDVKVQDLITQITQNADTNTAGAVHMHQELVDKLNKNTKVFDVKVKELADKITKVSNTSSNLISTKYKELADRLNKNGTTVESRIKDLINQTVRVSDKNSASAKKDYQELYAKLAENIASYNALANELSELASQQNTGQISIADIQDKMKALEQNSYKLLQQNAEPYWANVYHDTINNSSWLKNKSVSPGRWAVSYIVLYVLYRILDETKPRAVLECGLGQSSKLTIQYAMANNADLMICENNSEWLAFFKRQFPIADKYTKILDAEMIHVVPEYESRTYAGFKSALGDKKFNLVLIDGPLGSEHYSRPQVLDVVDNLDKSFVILLDDMNRIGEQETFELLKNKLTEKHIKFRQGVYESDKKLGLICSPDLEWLVTL
jgi:glycosyltransferase involved in cell wall biosynthesis